MIPVVTGILVLLGSFFCLSAALGVLRLPDVYARMHAGTKAGTLGIGCLFVAIAVHFADLEITTRVIAGFAFFVLTAPVAAHLLARAAYFAGVAPWEGTYIDQLSARCKRELQKLEGFPFDKQ